MDLSAIINDLIKKTDDSNLVSDGYHTFGELYEHRIVNYLALCRLTVNQGLLLLKGRTDSYKTELGDTYQVWRSKAHSDGSVWDGWFLLGIGKEKGSQITYHLPERYWDKCDWAETLDMAPEFDSHTSEQVLQRLMYL